jgi:hypothetical protein
MIEESSNILKAPNVEVRYNFFPNNLLDLLVIHITGQTERKQKFILDNSCPPLINEALEHIVNSFGVKSLNIAILKKYSPGEPSTAFEFHRDPDEYKGLIFLCSLSGRATLTVAGPKICEILCLPNTVIAIPANTLHKVSEPDVNFGERCFLFLGFDSTF